MEYIASPPSPPLSRENGKQTNKPTSRTAILDLFVNHFWEGRKLLLITFKMRWRNEMGENPSAPFTETTFLRAHSENLDVNICFQAEDIMGMETSQLQI